MLTMVEVLTVSGRTLELPLRDVSNGYVVRDIDGLDPVKASIVSSRLAQVDGTIFQASRRESRNIVMKLGFEPDFVNTTVSDLRRNLYDYLMPKAPVVLRFHVDEEAYVDISGMVESLETSLFTKDPEVTISLICFDPDFYALDTVAVTGVSAPSGGRFIDYEGDVETGLIFTLNVGRSIPGFTLTMDNGTLFQRFELTAPLVSGDVVTVDTRRGQKGAVRTRGGSNSSLLYAVAPTSTWAELYPGTNTFEVRIAGAGVPYTVHYVPKYGGL